ncbi:type II secretion system F family protein [Allohahella marinimesophila]|uniref:Type II secretion system protein GspF domain-containing protein n=1 Tax=Allohahella marinimesophila TaxID=1054972 RepID=A0ABP7PP46_9GAMM
MDEYLMLTSNFIICLYVLSACLLVWGLWRLVAWMRAQHRDYMDPLPRFLRLIWPLVAALEPLADLLVPQRLHQRLEQQLLTSGMSFVLTSAEYISLHVVSAFLSMSLGWICLNIVESDSSIASLVLLLLVGLVLPQLSVRDMRLKREKALVRALPVFVDYLVMTLEAGLNFSGALQQAVAKGPDGPLRNEFARVLRDIRAGKGKSQALRELASRNQVKELNLLVNAIVQAEQSGSSLSGTLSIQAEQRRNERFQRAEKLALQAPVKLVFPLVAFIFPITFILLGFPIVMKFMYEL